jgi:hypothetical protein
MGREGGRRGGTPFSLVFSYPWARIGVAPDIDVLLTSEWIIRGILDAIVSTSIAGAVAKSPDEAGNEAAAVAATARVDIATPTCTQCPVLMHPIGFVILPALVHRARSDYPNIRQSQLASACVERCKVSLATRSRASIFTVTLERAAYNLHESDEVILR